MIESNLSGGASHLGAPPHDPQSHQLLMKKAGAPLLTFLILAVVLLFPYFLCGPSRRLKDFVVPATYSMDMYRYLSQINAPHQGRWFPGNDYLKEHVGDSPMDPKWCQAAAAVWSWPLYPDFRAMYIWICLGVAALWVLAVGALGNDSFRVGWAPWTFVLAASWFSMGEKLGRPIHPQVTAFPLLALFFLAAKKAHDGYGRRWAAMAGAAAGLLVYLYPFHWLVAGACLGVLTAYHLSRRLQGDTRAPLADFMLAAAIGAAISAESLWQRHLLGRLPGFSDIAYQWGQFHDRFPSFGSLAAYLFLAVPLTVWIPKGRRSFWICCLLGGLLVLGQNVITGLYIAGGPLHLYKPLGLLLSWAFYTALAGRLEEGGRRKLASIWVWLIAGICLMAAQAGQTLTESYSEEAMRLTAYAPALRWLSANAPKNSVVLAEEPDSSFVAAFTPDFPYIASYAMTSVIPISEVQARKLAELRFFGMPAGELRRYAAANFLPFWGLGPTSQSDRRRAWLIIRHFLGDKTPIPPLVQVPNSLLDALEKEYASHGPASPFLGFELDYVLWGPQERRMFPTFHPEKQLDLKKVYADDQVSVWSWKQR